MDIAVNATRIGMACGNVARALDFATVGSWRTARVLERAAMDLCFDLPLGGSAHDTWDYWRAAIDLHAVLGKLLQVRASLASGPATTRDGQLAMEALTDIQRIHHAITGAV